jgi:hypothetical protein
VFEDIDFELRPHDPWLGLDNDRLCEIYFESPEYIVPNVFNTIRLD